MKAIREHYGLEFSLVSALNAGVDMFIFGNQLSVAPQNIDEVIDLIEKNFVIAYRELCRRHSRRPCVLDRADAK